MLSDRDIDGLIQQIADRQEAINLWVLKKIAVRIDEIGKLAPSSLQTFRQMVRSGTDIKAIIRQLAKFTKRQAQEIKNLIIKVAANAYAGTKQYYDYRGLAYIPFKLNVALQRVVKSIARNTADTYTNISNATAFMIRDPKNPTILKPTPIAKAYQSVLDEAIQASQSGVVDYHTAMRKTLKQLIDSGIRRVEYSPESGRRYTQRLDTAVRRNLNDGVRAVNQGVQDITGEQFGATGKEITVHANSAPDHEPIQGHQFTNEEFEKLQNNESFTDVNGKKFAPIKRAIGVWNCRHFTYSIIVGVTKPNYTQKQLEELIQKNHTGYTAKDGTHYTMYECTQEQRRIEREIRYAKEAQIVAKTAGDMKLATIYQKEIRELMQQYTEFSKACGLKPRYDRTTVEGYIPLKASEYKY